MFSAEMLSWMLGARRFSSIARICDSRTPVTVISDKSSASLAPALEPALPAPFSFLTSGEGVVDACCCAEPCAPAFSAGVPVPSDAMVEVAAAASNAMDMAIDRGCLRYRFDTAFPSRLLSSGSQMPYAARSALPPACDPVTDCPAHLCPLAANLFGRLTNQSRMLCAFRQV